MNPPLMNESSFSTANPSSYTMSEIWPFNVDNSSGHMNLLGHTITGFAENLSNRDGSTVTDHSGGVGASRKRKSAKLEGIINLNNSDGKRLKVEAETSSGTGIKAAEQSTELPKKDYIHVRARSGQATDRHSLAERARREKISERMKILQDLVPGCNTVIGKALVLDEIINYVQSLQCQVEFLSMKLEAVDPRTSMATERFPPKDVFITDAMILCPQETRQYAQISETEWPHMQLSDNLKEENFVEFDNQ